MAQVGAKKYTSAYGGVPVTLSGAAATQWVDERNDVGSASLELHRSDADMPAYGAIVALTLGGTTRYAFRVEQKDQQTLGATDAAETVKVAGRGLLSLFEEVVLYPELGLGRISPDYRLFNFASTYYDDTAWVAATQIKQQKTVSSQWPYSPADWPDQDAYWIWGQAQGAGSPPQPVGDCYFRKTFTLASQQTLRAYISADDGFEFYFDGAKWAGETTAFMWGETKYVDLGLVDTGTHTIAIKGTNMLRDSAATNVAGVICSVIEMTDGGNTVGTVRARTDNTWKALAYPSAAPGMTPGQILDQLMSEAQTRGALSGWTNDFTSTLDTAAVAWTAVDIGFSVGTSYLEVIRALCETSIDVRCGPDALALHAWKKPGGANRSATVVLNASNLADLRHDGRAATFNTGLSRTASGAWYEKNDATSTTAYGRKEGFLELGTAPSTTSADRVVTAQFDVRAQPANHTQAEVVSATVVPYTSFQVGDIVSLANEALTQVNATVESIAVTVDDVGEAIFRVEF